MLLEINLFKRGLDKGISLEKMLSNEHERDNARNLIIVCFLVYSFNYSIDISLVDIDKEKNQYSPYFLQT